jgi:hypothetical protein
MLFLKSCPKSEMLPLIAREHFCLGANSKSSILSSAEQRGARIEGCGLAKTRRVRRTLRYDLKACVVFKINGWSKRPGVT